MEQGDFGNLAVQYAKKALNMKVIVVDINDDKLNLAKEVGADYAINSLHEDPIKKISELTNGGAHGAVVSAVAKKAFDQAIYSVRAGGRVVAENNIEQNQIDDTEVSSSNYTQDEILSNDDIRKKIEEYMNNLDKKQKELNNKSKAKEQDEIEK